MEFIERYPDKPWDWYRGISRNPNLTMDIIERYPDKPWSWDAISCNPNITIKFIERHLDKAWDWYEISRNPNITMKFIERYPDKPWSWNGMLRNPNVTMKFIEKHPDKELNWYEISCNRFSKHPVLVKKKIRLEYLCKRIVARRILKWIKELCNEKSLHDYLWEPVSGKMFHKTFKDINKLGNVSYYLLFIIYYTIFILYKN